MSVRIHIERLTVEGASRADAAHAGEALREHLAQLVSRGIAPKTSRIVRLDAGEIPHASGMEGAGRQAAQRIFTHLSGAAPGKGVTRA